MSSFFPLIAEMTFQGSPAEWANLEHIWIVGLTYILIGIAGLLVDGVMAVRLFVSPPEWARPGLVLQRRPWSWTEGLQFTAILILLHSAAILFLYGLHRAAPPTEESDGIAVVVQSVAFHWAGLLLIVAAVRRKQTTWRSAFGLNHLTIGKEIGLGVLFYLAAMPFVLFYSWLYELGLRYAGYQPELQEVAWALTGEMSLWLRIYLMTFAITIAPLFEEFFFRGIGLPLISRVVGVPGAVIVLSVIFAIMHFHIPALVPLFVIAAAFALAYIYTGSIVVPITMHALFNGLNLAMLTLLRTP